MKTPLPFLPRPRPASSTLSESISAFQSVAMIEDAPFRTASASQANPPTLQYQASNQAVDMSSQTGGWQGGSVSAC